MQGKIECKIRQGKEYTILKRRNQNGRKQSRIGEKRIGDSRKRREQKGGVEDGRVEKRRDTTQSQYFTSSLQVSLDYLISVDIYNSNSLIDERL